MERKPAFPGLYQKILPETMMKKLILSNVKLTLKQIVTRSRNVSGTTQDWGWNIRYSLSSIVKATLIQLLYRFWQVQPS